MAEAVRAMHEQAPNDTGTIPAHGTDIITTDFFKFRKDRSAIKHAILKRYFDAWLPIISQSKYIPYYIDGFAGPGKYKDGTEGSPLLVYSAAVNHTLSKNFKEPVHMIFIEYNKKHADTLRVALAAKEEEFRKVGKITDKVKYEVLTGKFHDEMEKILSQIDNLEAEAVEHKPEIAMLAFVDPFGFSGSDIPMTLMRRIMVRAKRSPTELFINVMDGFANRFFNCESRADAIHKFLGTEDWQLRVLPEGEELSSAERIERFMEIYINELGRDADAELYPLKFGMKNEINRHTYTLLFVTRHLKGLVAMKEAMWKQTQNPDGFQFSEFVQRKDLPDSFNSLPDAARKEYFKNVILEYLITEFRGKGQTKGIEFEQFILAKTIYLFNVKVNLKAAMNKEGYIPLPSKPQKGRIKFEDVVFVIPPNATISLPSI